MRTKPVWRPNELAQDALRNLSARQVFLGILCFGVITATAFFAGAQAHSSIAQEEIQRAQGSQIWSAVSDDGTDMSAASCSNLQDYEGIAASGGIATSSLPPKLATYPGGAGTTAYYVTPGLPVVFDSTAEPGSVVLGPDARTLNRASVGAFLVDEDGDRVVRIEGYLVETVPYDRLRSSLLIPSFITRVNECWLRMAPGAEHLGREVLVGAFPSDPILVVRFAPPPEGLLSPLDQWRAVASVWPWVISGSLAGFAISVITWSRRPEFAIYRLFGTSRHELVALISIESLMVVFPATVAGTVASALAIEYAFGASALTLSVTLLSAGAAGAAALVSSVLFALTALGGNALHVLRDR